MTAKKTTTTAAKTETPDIPAEAPKTETPDVAAETPAIESPAETPASTDPVADADTDDETDKEAEEEVVKRNFAKIRIKDFRGSFGNAFFDDNGVCEECDEVTAKALQEFFPGADVEVLSH